MRQLLETNQTTQNNLTVIMLELQPIRHQMKYSNSHETTVQDRNNPPSSIHAAPNMQQYTPPPTQTQPPFVPPFPPQHMPPRTRPPMQQHLTPQWMTPPPGFHRYNIMHESSSFGMTSGGQGRRCGNRTHNNYYGFLWNPQSFKCNATIPLLHSNSTTSTIAYYFSCGYDTYQEGHSCLWDIHNTKHTPSVTWANAHLFTDASLFGTHKAILP